MSATSMPWFSGGFVAWRIRALLPRLRRFCGRSRKRGRVLAIIPGGLGDKLMALPAVRAFRREFEGGSLTVIFVGLVPPFVESEGDEVIGIGSGETGRLLRLAARGYDAVFVSSIGIFDVRMEIAAFLSGARDLRGPRFATIPATNIVYTRSYEFGVGHETAVNLRGVGVAEPPPKSDYALRAEIPAPSGTPVDVILHPGSSGCGLASRWPVERYAELANRLATEGFSVAAVGTPPEADVLDVLRARTSAAIWDDLSMEELAARMARARLVIANESGIGHLAASLGVPVLTLIGATQPEKVAPVGRRVTILDSHCEHGGCYNNPAVKECKLCIHRLSVADVWAAARQKLQP
jgi:ADP-heptose:LPS heptosyltransferase